MTKIICISDTHRQHNKVVVPPGDILIHAGDWSYDMYERPDSVAFTEFLQWYESQPHKHKILVAGNHDQLLEMNPELARSLMDTHAPSVKYLEDSGTVAGGLSIWGSPMTPTFYDWSFNRDRGLPIKLHWELIPEKVDILVTHGPAYSIGDKNYHDARVGDKDLLEAIIRVKPKVHICGHVHGGHGRVRFHCGDGHEVTCYNVSICDEKYRPRREATVFNINSGEPDDIK